MRKTARRPSRKSFIRPFSSFVLTALLCVTLGIQTFIFHAPRAEAAAVSWTGGATGNWGTGSNWSSNAVPTVSDDVTINRSGGVIVDADINISFSTLTIGGGSDSNILLLTNNIATGGSITIGNNGSLIQKNFVAQTITGTLTMNSGGILQHEENTTAESYKVDFTAATITVNSGASINVNARGYQGDQAFKAGGEGHNGHGPGKGLNQSSYEAGSGAGHGGAGGANAIQGGGEAGGSAYCNATNPSTIGSGGGGSGNAPAAGKGGDGGGLVRLTSTGDITMSGSILANGGDGGEDGGNDGGGGSGGGIYIYGNTIDAHLGTVEAKGGNSGNGNSGGGGGGGCIFYSYTSNAYAGFPNSVTAGVGTNNGSAGTYNTTQRTPTLSFDSASSSGGEPVNGTITINRSGSTVGDVSVHYTVTGTATQGTDFTALSGKLTITSGSSSGTISIPVTNDTTDEANETVILTIYSPTGATLGATTAHTYTINDDDSGPTVQFAATTSYDSEGKTIALIPVSLSEASTNNVTVSYEVTGTATGSGTDYTLADGNITIEAGKTTKNISIAVIDDALIESDETVVITLMAPSNASLGANTVHAYTLKDNDGTPTVAFVLTNSEVSETAGSKSIGVQLSRNPAGGQSVDVTYTISGGTAVSGVNYTLLASGTVPLPNTTVVNITPTIITDSDAINQTLIITLSSPTNANLGVNTVHTLTIREPTVTSSTPTFATANGMPTPASVATNNPVISWKSTPSITGDSQTAYQVVFASSEANLNAETYTCDSGKITSNKSVNTYANLCSNNTLTAGTYYWKVRTYNSSDTASSYTATQTLTVSSIITTPTSCTTSSLARSSFTLGWTDNASNETGYEIEQSLTTFSGMSIVSNNTYRRITTTAASAVSYDVTGLSPNTSYYFRIRAINNTGTSTYLTCSSIMTLAATPSTPALTPLSTTSINVIINPEGNSTMTTYAIQVNTTQYVQADGTLGVSAVYQSFDSWGSRGKAVTGLTANTAYIIGIIGRNGNNEVTSTSTTATIYTLAEKVIISTSSPAASSFYVSVDANGNPAGTLTSITINDETQTRYLQANASLSHAEVKQTPATWGSLQITNLVTDIDYRLQAISYNGDNVPTYSLTAAQNTTASAPTSFRVTSLTNTTYAVSVATQSGYQYNFNSTGLQAGNTFSGAITAADGVVNKTIKLNNGADTPIVSMGICAGAATPGTATIDNSATTSTSIKLAIDASTNGASIEYQIHDIISNTYVTRYGTLTTTPTWDTKTNLGGDSGITINGLTSGGDYEFRVRARNCQNIETAYSASRIAEIPAKIPSPPTISVTSDNNGVSSARIFVDTTGFSSRGLTTVEFAIYDITTNQYVGNTQGATSGNGALQSSAAWNLHESWGGSSGFPIYNLPSNVTHQFAVKARKTVNSTPVETGFSQKTSLVLGVNKSAISVNTVTSSSISLQINPLGNSVENTRYLIELVGDSSSSYLQNGGTNNTFGGTESWAGLSSWDGYDGTSDGLVTISGLSPNTSYTFRIKARNSDEVAGYVSPTITIYSGAATPTSITATVASEQRINLSWSVASNPAGTEYLILESSTSKYVVSGALSTTATWSTFDNATPTNATAVSGLTAGTQYCFIITPRNTHTVEGTAASQVCGTTTAATSSSSGGGGGGGGSAAATATTTTTPTTTPTTTDAAKTDTTKDTTPAKDMPTKDTAATTDSQKTEPVATPQAPTDTTKPVAATTTTPSATTTPVAPQNTSTPTDSANTSSTSTSSNGGSGGGSSSSAPITSLNKELEQLKKDREEIEKQKEQGMIAFSTGKTVQVPGAKSFVGITRSEFLTALTTDVNFEKAYSDKTARAVKAEVTNSVQPNEQKDQYIKSNEAYSAILIAINVTEIESCKLKIFDKCSWTTEDSYLTTATRDQLLKHARNYINDLATQRARTQDTDKDGIPDFTEINEYETNPKMSDTDGDLAFDSDEIFKLKTDPLIADTDGDGLSDGEEFKKYKTSPLLRDTDNDGWNDKEDSAPRDPLIPGERQEEASGTQDKDEDGLADREERDIGTNPEKNDTDGDGTKDGEEVAAGTDPKKFETVKDIETTITNLRSGMRMADSPLVKGGSKANNTVIIYARNDLGLKKEVGRTEASSNNLYAIQLRPLPDGVYYFQAVDTQGKSSLPVKTIIDSTLRLRGPVLLRMNDRELSTDDITRSKSEEVSEFTSNSRPTFEFRNEPGARNIYTTRSAISTAILISDTPSGIIEMRPPEELEIGDHEIIAYSIKEDENIVSPVTTFRFRVTEASSYSDDQYRIKSRDSGNLLAFFREKSVKPLFAKIFIGVGAVLIIWALVSIYQKRKRDEAEEEPRK